MAEAILTHARGDFELQLLVEDLLRPALVLADSMEGTPWPAMRALALRCLALHGSLCGVEEHWDFFQQVLVQQIPLVLEEGF